MSSAKNSDFSIFSFSKRLVIGDIKESVAFLKEKCIGLSYSSSEQGNLLELASADKAY